MTEKIIVQSYEGHLKIQLFLWAVPIMFVTLSFFQFKEFWPMFLIGASWLALLVYFKFLRKK